jgi:protease I
MNRLRSRRAVFVIAHRMFRDEEYMVPREMLESEGAAIAVASTDLSTAEGKLGIQVKPDLLIRDIAPESFDAIVFVGGAGCKCYWNDEAAHAIVRSFFEAGKPTAAICSAPVILANAGILAGRTATCYPEDKADLENGGVQYVDESVHVDGNVITANGHEASSEFAEAIIAQFD